MNPISSDPLDQDSMDPTDPNSIMYDPSLASREGVAAIMPTPIGEIVIADPTASTDDATSLLIDVNKSQASSLRDLRNLGHKL